MEPRVKERYDGLLKRRWATADFVRPPFHGVLSHILEHLGIIIFILYFLCNITLSITTSAQALPLPEHVVISRQSPCAQNRPTVAVSRYDHQSHTLEEGLRSRRQFSSGILSVSGSQHHFR